MSKLYPCKKCGTKVSIRSKGLCPLCREKQRREQGEETMLSKYSSLNPISEKKKKEKGEKKKELDPFFSYHIKQIKNNPVCNNCGAKLHGLRGEVAHILPKRKQGGHPEVMSNLDNAIYLCMFENSCHSQFDQLQYTKEVYQMACWPKAVDKYLKLKPFLKKTTKISKNFDNYLENWNR